jgi:hypothetical protein
MFTWWVQKSSTVSLQAMDARLPREFHVVLAASGVLGLREALPRLSAELDRSRRYQHQLTVSSFEEDGIVPAGTMLADYALSPGSHGLIPAVLASVLRETTRATDIVTYAVALGRCLVAMPETSSAQGRQAVRRLRQLAARRLMFPVRASLATFPDEGLTLEELIRRMSSEESLSVAEPPAPAESASSPTRLISPLKAGARWPAASRER